MQMWGVQLLVSVYPGKKKSIKEWIPDFQIWEVCDKSLWYWSYKWDVGMKFNFEPWWWLWCGWVSARCCVPPRGSGVAISLGATGASLPCPAELGWWVSLRQGDWLNSQTPHWSTWCGVGGLWSGILDHPVPLTVPGPLDGLCLRAGWELGCSSRLPGGSSCRVKHYM